MPSQFLIVIGGPTAVGKTKLAIALAQRYNCEIVSADGRQFYREMNIGTAKPSLNELAQVKHHFINNKSVTELYGAGHYEKEAIPLIEQLLKEHDIAVLVGGSGLYINAILNGVDEFPEVPTHIREHLNTTFAQNGLAWLQQQLKQKDEAYYNLVDINNPQRIIRALEIIEWSGQTFSSQLKQTQVQRSFTAIPIFINTERHLLYQHINSRVETMMEMDWLAEAKTLLPYRHCNALKTVGYTELMAHLDGAYSLAEAIDKIKQRTRHYAKRQITWFKNQGNFETFAPQALEAITAYIDLIRQHD